MTWEGGRGLLIDQCRTWQDMCDDPGQGAIDESHLDFGWHIKR